VQARSCGICGGQSGTGAGFPRVHPFPLPIFIPPIVATVLSGLILTPPITTTATTLGPRYCDFYCIQQMSNLPMNFYKFYKIILMSIFIFYQGNTAMQFQYLYLLKGKMLAS
jgi:hypothetical protein